MKFNISIVNYLRHSSLIITVPENQLLVYINSWPHSKESLSYYEGVLSHCVNKEKYVNISTMFLGYQIYPKDGSCFVYTTYCAHLIYKFFSEYLELPLYNMITSIDMVNMMRSYIFNKSIFVISNMNYDDEILSEKQLENIKCNIFTSCYMKMAVSNEFIKENSR